MQTVEQTPSAPARGPWKQPPPPDPLREVKDAVAAHLNSQEQTVFALLDAARNERVLKLLQEFAAPAGLPDNPRAQSPADDPIRCEYQSLYIGKMAVEMAEQGPHLVRLPKQCLLLGALINEGWGDSWGTFLTSQATFAELRGHFRHFLMVRHPDGDAMFFRFYDPRVLRPFLSVSVADELSQFFGPVITFCHESRLGQYAQSSTVDASKLVQTTIHP